MRTSDLFLPPARVVPPLILLGSASPPRPIPRGPRIAFQCPCLFSLSPRAVNRSPIAPNDLPHQWVQYVLALREWGVERLVPTASLVEFDEQLKSSFVGRSCVFCFQLESRVLLPVFRPRGSQFSTFCFDRQSDPGSNHPRGPSSVPVERAPSFRRGSFVAGPECANLEIAWMISAIGGSTPVRVSPCIEVAGLR